MTTSQIANELKNKGFDAKVSDGLVFVSLNRKVDTMEVWTALNFRIEQEHMATSGRRVVIIGMEK